MSTPIARPARRCSRSSSGTAGSSSAGPGMFSPWRVATLPPTSTSPSSSWSPSRTVRTRSRTAPSARYITSPAATALTRPGHETDIRLASPGTPSSSQTNVTMSPTLRSTTPSASSPIRSLGPGRSWRIATGRPARPAASRTSSTVSAWTSWLACEKFSRATSMPASTISTSVSRSREAGPIVATIFVRRIRRSRYAASAADGATSRPDSRQSCSAATTRGQNWSPARRSISLSASSSGRPGR